MNTDDLLRDRLRTAADAAGAHANAADALRLVNQGPPPPTAGPKLWLVSVVAVVALAAGTLAGATVLSPGAKADPRAGGNGGGDATALPASPNGGPTLMAGTVYDCPGGAEVGKLRAGDRVYVVGRDESGSWAAIRDPQRIADVAWVEQSLLVPDGDIDVETMRCTEPTALVTPGASTTTTTTTAAPEAPSTTIAPTPQPGNSTTTTRPTGSTTPSTSTTTTTAAPDSQLPTVQASASRYQIDPRSGAYCTATSTSVITVIASDNVGVTSVTATYAGLPGSPLTFTRAGGSETNGTWTATFGPFTTTTARTVQITVTVRDANGNSADDTVTIEYSGVCLI